MADRKRILIVDDDADFVSVIRADLQHQGYEVLAATNGKDALRVAAAERLDLILLDVMMPEIDGYHVASAISSNASARAPKIIIMTCRDTKREKGVALFSGASAMVQKPFSMKTLHRKISDILEKA